MFSTNEKQKSRPQGTGRYTEKDHSTWITEKPETREHIAHTNIWTEENGKEKRNRMGK
jgi:hypothetical protein